MLDRKQIGNALSGLGAGFSGRGLEWQQQQMQQQEAMDAKRREAAVSDVITLARYNKQDPTGKLAYGFLKDRKEAIKEMGLPDIYNQQWMGQIEAGDIAGFTSAINGEMEDLYTQGILKPPAQEAGFSLSPGQTRFDAQGGVVASVEGKREAPKTRELKVGNRIVTQQLDPKTGKFETISSAPRFNPKGGMNINVGGENLTYEQQLELVGKEKYAEEYAKVRAKGIGKRESEDMASGLMAAEAVPILSRSLALMKDIKTGGIDGAMLKAKSYFGFESANEAELINNLSQSVLMQIKPLFGAAPSAKEGEWLRKIEATAGMSTQGVTALLNKGLALAKARANRGVKAANFAQDHRMAQDIRDFMRIDLGEAQEPEDVNIDTLLEKYK